MFAGKLIGIAVGSNPGGPMELVERIEVLAGQGLVGDRYAQAKGTFQRGRVEPMQQVTLIETEALVAASRDYDRPVTHLATRRNLLTERVPLNHLVDREFWVGNVKLRGLKLCEPCKHLEKLSGSGLIEALRHRGGLRAEVLIGGVLQKDDVVRPEG